MNTTNPIIISAGSLTDFENYTIMVYDGFAVGSDGTNVIRWKFPTMDSLSSEQISEAMVYRFGEDWTSRGVTPWTEDIFMKYGVQQVGVHGTLWARKCDATGKGMNNGWCFGDGEQYASTQDIAEDIAEGRGFESLSEAFEHDDCYWTMWEDINDYQYFEHDGKLIEIK